MRDSVRGRKERRLESEGGGGEERHFFLLHGVERAGSNTTGITIPLVKGDGCSLPIEREKRRGKKKKSTSSPVRRRENR